MDSKNFQENSSEQFLKVTNAIYLLTEFLSDDILRQKIREKALDIFSSLSLLFSPNPKPSFKEKIDLFLKIEKDIEVLQNFLELAKTQNFLQSFNYLIIKNEYDKIKKIIKEKSAFSEKKEFLVQKKNFSEKKEQPASFKKDFEFSLRQQKILEIVGQKQKIQVSDLKSVFPKISKRTLRRDLVFLTKKGLLKREGQWNQVYYTLKG